MPPDSPDDGAHAAADPGTAVTMACDTRHAPPPMVHRAQWVGSPGSTPIRDPGHAESATPAFGVAGAGIAR